MRSVRIPEQSCEMCDLERYPPEIDVCLAFLRRRAMLLLGDWKQVGSGTARVLRLIQLLLGASLGKITRWKLDALSVSSYLSYVSWLHSHTAEAFSLAQRGMSAQSLSACSRALCST